MIVSFVWLCKVALVLLGKKENEEDEKKRFDLQLQVGGVLAAPLFSFAMDAQKKEKKSIREAHEIHPTSKAKRIPGVWRSSAMQEVHSTLCLS